MKPPQRRRRVPARFAVGGEAAAAPAAWSPREMRQLLRLLQARRGQPEPDAAELAAELRDRSEAEVRVFLERLKRRARAGLGGGVGSGGGGGSGRGEPPPAPVEVWLRLAETLTAPLEDALAAAFAQVLTVAAVEPLGLLHSVPRRPTRARGRPTPLLLPAGDAGTSGASASPAGTAPTGSGPAPAPSGPATEAPDSAFVQPGPAPAPPGSAPEDRPTIFPSGPTSEPPGPAPEAPGPSIFSSGSAPPGPAPAPPGPSPAPPGPSPAPPGPAPAPPGPAPAPPGPAPALQAAESGLSVDFEKIYRFLSSCCRARPDLSALSALSPAEAAVLLQLLSVLPEELARLPCAAAAEHLTGAHARLTGPPAAGDDAGEDAPAPAGGGGGGDPAGRGAAWRSAGTCPLNPFLLPLELLARAPAPAP